MTIAISNFVRRQTPESQFSHWTWNDEELLTFVREKFNEAKPGYRDGVILVPVPALGFYSNTVQMVENDIIVGIYKPRQASEEPRRQTFVLGGNKLPAQRVDIVLYRHDVLVEGNEQSCDAEWEIISVNAEITDGTVPSPMKPSTLMANHYVMSGGTDTGMTPEGFQAALKRSVEYWKDKGDAAPAMLVPPATGDFVLEIAASSLNARYNEFREAALYYQATLATHNKNRLANRRES
jgi:hypothetical protein